VLRLAQWIAPILCAGKDSSRPSKGRMARDLVSLAFQHSGVRRVRVLCVLHLETPNPQAPKVGPAVSRSSLSRPSKGDTWCVIRLLSFSPIATLRHKQQLLHNPEARNSKSVQDPGPQHHQVSSGPSDLRGTRGTQLSHLGVSLITTMIRKDQLLPIHER
jgi:hypothetical protein